MLTDFRTTGERSGKRRPEIQRLRCGADGSYRGLIGDTAMIAREGQHLFGLDEVELETFD